MEMSCEYDLVEPISPRKLLSSINKEKIPKTV